MEVDWKVWSAWHWAWCSIFRISRLKKLVSPVTEMNLAHLWYCNVDTITHALPPSSVTVWSICRAESSWESLWKWTNAQSKRRASWMSCWDLGAFPQTSQAHHSHVPTTKTPMMPPTSNETNNRLWSLPVLHPKMPVVFSVHPALPWQAVQPLRWSWQWVL